MYEIQKTDIRSGQVLRVHQQITEGDKTRTQVFEGTVIKRRGGNTPGATFTIRKKSGNVWVEKIFPIHLPTIEKVELVKEMQTRRAQLTFLRNVKFKKKMKDITEKIWGNKKEEESSAEAPTEPETTETPEPTAEETKPEPAAEAQEEKPEEPAATEEKKENETK